MNIILKILESAKNQIADYDGFHFENLQSAKYQIGSIFFELKISQLYIIMYFYVI